LLDEAKLIGAELIGTNLSRAFLEGANLIGADFTGADLSGAFLDNASFMGSNLAEVDLEGAFLRWANLRRVKNLSAKQLSKATTFHGAELDEELREKVVKVV
jgi:uncharacterized protein YjbI with pentapeptide repeats